MRNDLSLVVCDEHSQALVAWTRRGIRGRALVVLDARLDLKRISDERLTWLRKTRSPVEMARLDRGHALMPLRHSAYGPDDFLFAAHRLGVISEIIWVRPEYLAQDQTGLRQLSLFDGMSTADLGSFNRRGTVTRGQLLGIPLILCGIQDLASLDLPADAILDIDLGYFFSTSDETMRIEPRAVVETLSMNFPSPDCITIANSHGGGAVPLDYRFVSDLLASLWREDPSGIAHYQRILKCQQLIDQGDHVGARELVASEPSRAPDCAATAWLRSRCAANSTDAQRYRELAIQLDGAYGHDVLYRACSLLHRRDLDEQTVDRFAAELRRDAVTEEVDMTLVHIVCSILYSRLGLLQPARRHYAEYRRRRGGQRHEELDFEIGRILFRQGRLAFAKVFLQSASREDRARGRCHSLLASLFLKQHAYDRAARSLLVLREYYPTWNKPLETLVRIQHLIRDPALRKTAQEQLRSRPASGMVPVEFDTPSSDG